jgi:hypothetical protein
VRGSNVMRCVTSVAAAGRDTAGLSTGLGSPNRPGRALGGNSRIAAHRLQIRAADESAHHFRRTGHFANSRGR